MLKGNCIIGQSGGPTAVINSSVLGLVHGAFYAPEIEKVLGVRYGVEGILKNKIFDFAREDPRELNLLRNTPSSALGTCRYKLHDYEENEADYEKIFDVFQKNNIRYFFYIGGNDSMDTVNKLNKYAEKINYDIVIIGVPKTIDNDLLGTDHTPGYGSAAKFIATSVMEVAHDSQVYDKENVHIIEVMGRNAGWLAASSVLARVDVSKAPDLIYLPERTFSLDRFMSDVEKVFKKKKNVLIVVSEGIKDKNGDYLQARKSSEHDEFGHKQMGGVSRFLAGFVKENICNRVKALEMNILQRASMHFASRIDIEEAYQCGRDAIKFALRGKSGQMVSLVRDSTSPYEYSTRIVPVEEVANHEKIVPDEWINESGNFVTDDLFQYVQPLIMGKVGLPLENGLPRYANLEMKYIT